MKILVFVTLLVILFDLVVLHLIQVPLQSPLIPTIEMVVAIFENFFPCKRVSHPEMVRKKRNLVIKYFGIWPDKLLDERSKS